MLFRKVLTLLNGKKTNSFIWEVLLFVKTTFNASEDIDIPVGKVLTLHSPSIDGEFLIDGEGYIL